MVETVTRSVGSHPSSKITYLYDNDYFGLKLPRPICIVHHQKYNLDLVAQQKNTNEKKKSDGA